MPLRRTLFALLLCLTQLTVFAADQKPEPVKTAQPIYPFDEYKSGVPGKALVEFIVETDGTVSNIKLIKATTKGFGQSAISCISKWKFKPGIKDDHAVQTRMQQTFYFEKPNK